MWREILGLLPLIFFTIWLFVALPLIYLNGGPDQMIDKIPAWAPVVTAMAATCAAMIAFRAFTVARQQLGVVVQNQRETTAKTNFREFLKLCAEYPDLARGTPTEQNLAKYEWFVAHFLWATEEILEYAPGPWLDNLQLHVEYHGKYFENDKDFRTKDFKTYTKELQDFLIKIIPSLKTCR
jgi:hypothetical protein